jgi:hypothetical protein
MRGRGSALSNVTRGADILFGRSHNNGSTDWTARPGAITPGFFVPAFSLVRAFDDILLMEREGEPMTLDEVILELYRLAETKKWDGSRSDEALALAVEGMEQIWTHRQAAVRRNSKAQPAGKQPRIWS